MNIILVAGNVGKNNAETRATKGGESYTTFSVGADAGAGNNKKTLWYDCTIWGDRGEKVAQYLTTGTPVTITGELNTREWEDKKGVTQTSLTIRIDKLKLQGGKRDGGSGKPAGGSYNDDLDDELPF